MGTLTEVEFHTGVADSIGFTCRLVRKACRLGARVLVTAPEATLRELDRALWTFEEREFVPHVRMPGAAAAVAARTPVWLAGDAGTAGAPGVLVNLGGQAPADVGALQRLIEVVSADPDDAARGRERWRAYKAAGLQIKHHATAAARD
ncbi:MAG: DNA polymerase III subunit chi [Rubrivivax sp.]|nr:DNA polymerase III subunit chi [Rubrivivax sp.]